MIRSYFNAVAQEINQNVDVNGYGEPKFQTVGRDVECRKMEKTKLVRSVEGDEVLSSIEVWFSPDIEKLPPQSEIVFDGKARTVIISSYLPGISENICLQVFLK